MSDLEIAPSEIQNAPVVSWASKSISGDVAQILLALEEGIPVTLITSFNLIVCKLDDKVEEVLSRPDIQGFDYIPVYDESESIVGVLVRQDALQPNEPVKEAMRKLHPSMLISADASLLSFVAEADKTPYCLVLQRRRIEGIVTLSDLQKLAVRPVLFSLITCVELLLAEWLRQKYPNEQDWLSKLSEERRKKVEENYERYSQQDMAIDRMTTTEFCDKRVAALKLGAFPTDEDARGTQLKEIQKLRDSIAHAGDYALTAEKAKWVAQTVRSALEIIELLEKSLSVIALR